MIQLMNKKKLIREFKIMKYLEVAARDHYLLICNDPAVKDNNIKTSFKNIADDETRHIQIVQDIIELINTSL